MFVERLLTDAKKKFDAEALNDDLCRTGTNRQQLVLFFAVSDGRARAHVETVSGEDVDSIWQQARSRLVLWEGKNKKAVAWLRVEGVNRVQQFTWSAFQARLKKSKRNYFRFGISLDENFHTAMLEYELYANAVLYDTNTPLATPNANNLRAFGKRKFGRELAWPDDDDATLWCFKTRAVFASRQGSHLIEHAGRNSGYRQFGALDEDTTRSLIESSSAYLARQVKNDGEYHYGWFPCFDRAINTYNALRHASSTYALLEGWELTRDKKQGQAAEKALEFLAKRLIKHLPCPGHGVEAAFVVDRGDQIKLGANAVAILAFVKYTEVTQDQRYLELMAKLAEGILFMQKPDSGKFVHVLNYPDLNVRDEHRIVYYDGEAAFGLMRLYGLTGNERWRQAVEHAFEYFISVDHWKNHDHWLGYCVNELTLYNPDPRNYKFGLDNVRDHLDFVLNRLTTFPTLLEQMMAAHRMIERMRSDPSVSHLLDDFDTDKFYRALEHRARYLVNGYFYPEVAMFFKNPARIVGSFFIRHHTFRVRIDDVEHYLSGLVGYLKYIQNNNAATTPTERTVSDPQTVEIPESKPPTATIAFGGDVNLGRRQHYRTAELGVSKVLDIPALKNADLSIVNLECVIANIGKRRIDKGEGGPHYYRARPEMVEILVESGVDLVAVANNHSGDYGPEALLQQAEILDNTGIGHAGSGRNSTEAFKPVFSRAGDFNIALFSIDSTQWQFAASENTAGAAYLPMDTTTDWQSKLQPLIEQARQTAHIILVAVHWGPNLAAEPHDDERRIGKTIIDAGADAVLGTSAHVLQGIEIYKNKPIIHDAGDLLFDSVQTVLSPSAVFGLRIAAGGVKAVEITPVGRGFGFSRELLDGQGQTILRNYAESCRKLGTTLSITGGKGYVPLRPTENTKPVTALPPVPGHTPSYQESSLPALKKNSGLHEPFVPDDARITPITFGPLRLLGIRYPEGEFTKRQMLWVETWWVSNEIVKDDIRLNISARPVTRRNRIHVWGRSADHDPLDWMLPTTEWQPGHVYKDYCGLRPPRTRNILNVPLQLLVSTTGSRKLHKPTRVVPVRISRARSLTARNKIMYESADLPVRADRYERLWTVDELEAVTGGKWKGDNRDAYFQSAVRVFSHLKYVEPPVLYFASTRYDVWRHEYSVDQSDVYNKHWDSRDLIRRSDKRIAGVAVSTPVGFSSYLQVTDPIKAIIELGIANRKRLEGHLVAVTGSAGKTSTINILNSVFGAVGKSYKSYNNYNSRVGIMVAMASVAVNTDFCFIEVAKSAINAPGYRPIKHLAPDIGVITNITQSHLRPGETVRDVAIKKSNIFYGIKPNGYVILCRDMEYYDLIHDRACQFGLNILTYGKHTESDVQLIDYDSASGVVKCSTQDTVITYSLSVPGEHMAINSLAAIAIALTTDIDLKLVSSGFESIQPVRGRGEIIESQRFAGTKILDESYNANPASMRAALKLFSDLSRDQYLGKRRVVILGDMAELGDAALQSHLGLVDDIVESKVDVSVFVGEQMRNVYEKLRHRVSSCHYFTDTEELSIDTVLRNNDFVLIKGH